MFQIQRVRRVLQHGKYMDEMDLIRRENHALQTQLDDLEDELDEIISTESIEVILLMQDVRLHRLRYSQAHLRSLELEEQLRLLHTDIVTTEGCAPDLDKSASPASESIDSVHERSGCHQSIMQTCETTDVKKQKTSINAAYTLTSGPQISNRMTLASAHKHSEDDAEPNSYHLLIYPEDAPGSGWFYEAYHYLNVQLGSLYSELVRQWIEYERQHQWQTPRNRVGLNKTCRPLQLNVWIKNSRYKRTTSEVDNVQGLCTPQFVTSVQSWWVSLQPHWRSVDANGMPTTPEQFGDDWCSLDKHGINGWLGLLACVKWWGIGLKYYSGDDQMDLATQWHTLLVDMLYMLKGLCKLN